MVPQTRFPCEPQEVRLHEHTPLPTFTTRATPLLYYALGDHEEKFTSPIFPDCLSKCSTHGYLDEIDNIHLEDNKLLLEILLPGSGRIP